MRLHEYYILDYIKTKMESLISVSQKNLNYPLLRIILKELKDATEINRAISDLVKWNIPVLEEHHRLDIGNNQIIIGEEDGELITYGLGDRNGNMTHGIDHLVFDGNKSIFIDIESINVFMLNILKIVIKYIVMQHIPQMLQDNIILEFHKLSSRSIGKVIDQEKGGVIIYTRTILLSIRCEEILELPPVPYQTITKVETYETEN